ncbi:MAG TPA: PQQ-binding-like beta-propeller repeat protein, partial [Rhodanobacteraceae bacterium]|nr:PQQ-binding-like beta-propeller repeat protein [Rhodanobacteraceae bacterium]
MSARAALALCLLIATAMPVGAIAAVDVVTERYDDARLGANLEETTLDTSNVDVDGFGKRWSYTVSGSVYAQPLFVHGVTISGSPHDVLYVATMNNQVYAFDADAADDTPLLQASLGTPIPILDILGFNDNIIGNVGIESTPVIDRATSTLYLVARTREMGGGCGGANPTFCQRLHALDLATLAEKPGSPVAIGGSVPGHGSGSVGGTLTFDPKIEDQRASLALSNGRVFIAWSSHSDQLPYHGWVMAYDATTLAQTMIWSSAPDGTPFNGAGIWMSGRAPAVDASGNVYYTTGNGTWDGVSNFGESFVKFGPTPDAPLLDWFTPSAVDLLNQIDLDLAGSGPILVPGTDRIVSAGKSGVFYVTRTGDMGHESADDVNIVQRFDNSRIAGDFEQIKGGPVYWNRAGGLGPWMYVWSDGCNHFNAYRFNGSTFDLPPVSQSTALSPCGSSGGVLTLSANGSAAGSGIVWVSMPIAGDANSGVHAGVLRAYDADDLDHELWNS